MRHFGYLRHIDVSECLNLIARSSTSLSKLAARKTGRNAAAPRGALDLVIKGGQKNGPRRAGVLEPIGFIPPAEAEERYFAMLNDTAMAA